MSSVSLSPTAEKTSSAAVATSHQESLPSEDFSPTFCFGVGVIVIFLRIVLGIWAVFFLWHDELMFLFTKTG